MISIPTVQPVLFGFAINTDPWSLPTVALIEREKPTPQDESQEELQ
jgi:hypothetical protein